MDKQNVEMPVIQEVTDEELADSSIQLLNPKQQRFVHLYLSGGYSVTKIAKLLNMSQSGIRRWLKDDTIRGIIEQYQQDEDEIVKQGLKALRLKALYRMSDLVDSKVDGIAWQASKDILDRTGYKPSTKQEVNIEVTFEQQIKELAEKVEYIDVDYEPVESED